MRSKIAAVVGFVALISFLVWQESLIAVYPHHASANHRAAQYAAEESKPSPPDERIAYWTISLAAFTGVLAVVSSVQIFFLIRADKATQTAIDAATSANKINIQSVVTDNRAWIIVDGFEVTQRPTNKGRFTEMLVSVAWCNIGKTPALNCKTKMEFTFEYGNAPSLIAQLAAHERRVYNTNNTRYMVPGRGYKRGWGFSVSNDDVGIKELGIPVVYGVITYTLAIDFSIHQTGFVVHLWECAADDREKFVNLLRFGDPEIPIHRIGWDEERQHSHTSKTQNNSAHRAAAII